MATATPIGMAEGGFTRSLNVVIASQAKHRAFRHEDADQLVASVLATTAEGPSRPYPHCKQQIQVVLLATLIRPSDPSSHPPNEKRAQGMPGAGRNPWPASRKKLAAVTTGPTEHPAFPAR